MASEQERGFLEHARRRADVAHVFLDDSKPAGVGQGFGVVVVAGHFNFDLTQEAMRDFIFN